MSNVVHMNIAQPERLSTYNEAQLELIQRTVAKDLNRDEFDMYVAVCRRVGLDPFRKQIYANVYNKNNADKRSVVFITAIDGFRAIAERAGNYRPSEDEPEVVYSDDLKGPDNPKGIEKAVVVVWKRDDGGSWNRIKGVARWDEFAPLDEKVNYIDTGEVWPDSGKPKKERRPTGEFELDPKASFWRKMPSHMLAKCAEAQALRRGWPEDLSGLYAPEEMAQADLDERSASEVVEETREQQRLMRIGGGKSVPFVMEPGAPIEQIELGQVADRCMAYIEKTDSLTGLEAWRDRNRVGLQQFWARAGNDALEVKKALEGKIERLGKEV